MQTGPQVAIASGQKEVVTDSGQRDVINWQLSAYPSDKGMCVEVLYTGYRTVESGSCGLDLQNEPNVSGTRAIGAIQDIFPGADVKFVYGPTTQVVDRSDVALEGGELRQLTTVAAPSDVGGSNFNFYTTWVRTGTTVKSVTAIDTGPSGSGTAANAESMDSGTATDSMSSDGTEVVVDQLVEDDPYAGSDPAAETP